ncbi:MAG: hypothetical protein RMJ43_16405 [Chloroherpetonaceae bacterium]|nr:hypothetical protein [Chthonomonadaceae bacterium]MDW8209414.1 hypothetical protein [Chloroherpetonaceae bacterium]
MKDVPLPETGRADPPLDHRSPRPLHTSSREQRRDILVALSAATAYFVLHLVTPHIPASTLNAIGLTTFLSLVLILLFTATAARAMRALPLVLIQLSVAAILTVPQAVQSVFPDASLLSFMRHPALLRFYGALMAVPGLYGLLLVWLAVCFGALLSRLFREFKMLLPVGVTLALVDLYVVFGGGLVRQAESGKSEVAAMAMSALTVQLPAQRPTGGAAPMLLAVGFADFLFIAMFFACFVRFGIPSRNVLIALIFTLVLYMTLVVITGLSLPALIPIAVVCLGMNLRYFRYKRAEAFALLYAGLLVAAILTAMTLWAHNGSGP